LVVEAALVDRHRISIVGAGNQVVAERPPPAEALRRVGGIKRAGLVEAALSILVEPIPGAVELGL
jgi:hypothetical protein